MKNYIIITFLFLVNFGVNAQNAKVTGNSATFIAELKSIMSTDNRAESQKALSIFTKGWEEEKISQSDKDAIVQLAVLMDEEKLRANDFLSLMNVINATLEKPDNAKYLNEFFIKSKDLIINNKKNFPKFCSLLADLYQYNSIYFTESRKWILSDIDYDLKIVDNDFELSFKDVDLILYTQGDTSLIEKTSGTLYTQNNTWVGKSGFVYWTRVGFDRSEIFAKLKNYSFSVKNSEFSADSVDFSFPRAFNKPILGKLSDKGATTNRGLESSYPRFISYQSVFDIKNIFPNIDYKGGFSMQGAQILGTGTEESKARITIKQNNKPKLRAYSTSFSITDEKIAALKSNVIIYIDKDSIYHTQLIFNYLESKRTVSLSKENLGLSSTPFFDTYHQIEFGVDNMKWNIDDYEMEFYSISNPERPMPVLSSQFFNINEYDRVQGGLTYNPIKKLKTLSDNSRTRTFTVQEIADYYNNKPEFVKQQLLLLAVEGYLFYDAEREVVVLKDKLFHYFLSSYKLSDYDNIQFESVLKDRTQKNAILDLKSNELKLNGVKNVVVSDSQATVFFPKDGNLVVRKNRDMNFAGQVRSGRFDYWGDSFVFNYDKFLVNLENIDSVKFKFPRYNDKGDFLGLQQVQNTIEKVSGTLFIDNEKNKSGNKIFEQYPIFDCTKKSFVYYDRKYIYDNVYDKEKFFFQVNPFRIDRLDDFTADSLKFPGTFTSADIIPVINYELTIQEDFALGFIKETPMEGYKLYKGKGIAKNGKLFLSNKGFRGDCEVDYLVSQSYSSNHVFFPDSMNTKANKFEILANSSTKYPQVLGADVGTHWMPYEDSMYVNKKKEAIGVYEGKIDFDGDLVLTPTELVGIGEVNYQNLSLTSDNFAFFSKNVKSTSGELAIKTLSGKGNAVTASDVNSDIDLTKDMGYFQTNEDTTRVLLPSNSFATSLNNFTYDFNEKQVNFVQAEGQSAEDSYFESLKGDAKGLRFESSNAKFEIKDEEIFAKGVPYIIVADAKIFTPNEEILIKKDGSLGSYEGSEIITPIEEETHKIYDAFVNIFSSEKFTGYGYYDYVDKEEKTYKVKFEDIRVDENLHTIAVAKIKDNDNFFVTPFIKYKGDITLKSVAEFLNFNGFVKPEHKVEYLNTSWLKISDSLDPLSINIKVTGGVTEDGSTLHTGIYRNPKTLKQYQLLLGKKQNKEDVAVLDVTGNLTYDDVDNKFIVANEKYINTFLESGDFDFGETGVNLALLNLTNNQFELQGRFDLNLKLKHATVTSGGNFVSNPNRKNGTYNMTLLVNFPFDESNIKMMADSFIDNAFDANVAENELEHLPNAIASIINDDKDRITCVSDIMGTGIIPMVKETQKTFVINNAQFIYVDTLNAFLSFDSISVGSVGTITVDKKLNGSIYFEYNTEKSADQMVILIESAMGSFHYFSYKDGKMNYLSSDLDFLDMVKLNSKKVLKSNKGYSLSEASLEDAAYYKYDIAEKYQPKLEIKKKTKTK
jgi:hypothetical protein